MQFMTGTILAAFGVTYFKKPKPDKFSTKVPLTLGINCFFFSLLLFQNEKLDFE